MAEERPTRLSEGTEVALPLRNILSMILDGILYLLIEVIIMIFGHYLMIHM